MASFTDEAIPLSMQRHVEDTEHALYLMKNSDLYVETPWWPGDNWNERDPSSANPLCFVEMFHLMYQASGTADNWDFS